MMNRAVEVAGFLAQHGWDDALETPVAADFSSRRYARLRHADGRKAILMDADTDQKTPTFIVLAKHLRELGLSAPEILAADPFHGLVLMEDLGTKSFGRMLDERQDAKSLYLRATDVLVHLHSRFDRQNAYELDLPVFGGALLASQVELFLEAWFPYLKEREASREEGEAFYAAWKQALRGIEAMPQTLMLRDFMPDNLMDLSGREASQSVGVLDFQDAGLGPIVYDLASLCEVVRRDGGEDYLEVVLAHYHAAAKPGVSLADLRSASHILAAQRHMRILGVIARLATKTGRREKLSFAPRIWAYLNELLEDEALRPVGQWVTNFLGHEEAFNR